MNQEWTQKQQLVPKVTWAATRSQRPTTEKNLRRESLRAARPRVRRVGASCSCLLSRRFSAMGTACARICCNFHHVSSSSTPAMGAFHNLSITLQIDSDIFSCSTCLCMQWPKVNLDIPFHYWKASVQFQHRCETYCTYITKQKNILLLLYSSTVLYYLVWDLGALPSRCQSRGVKTVWATWWQEWQLQCLAAAGAGGYAGMPASARCPDPCCWLCIV